MDSEFRGSPGKLIPASHILTARLIANRIGVSFFRELANVFIIYQFEKPQEEGCRIAAIPSFCRFAPRLV